MFWVSLFLSIKHRWLKKRPLRGKFRWRIAPFSIHEGNRLALKRRAPNFPKSVGGSLACIVDLKNLRPANKKKT